jgi:transglutaminase/protease-like cytokinesis protein 3
MSLLLNKVGVETLFISGKMDSGTLHAWNIVKIDGFYYHVDTTFDDPIPDQKNRVFYDFYLKTDSEMREGRSWDESKFPVCNTVNQ